MVDDLARKPQPPNMGEKLPRWDGQDLADLLRLTPAGHGHFLSQNRETNDSGALFGGQVLAQALRAAQATIDRPAHTMQAEFLRAGASDVPVTYSVEHTRDGRGFSTRRVIATQHGKQIFHAQISFTGGEDGPTFLRPMPDVPPPEALDDEPTLAQRYAERLGPTGARRLAAQKTVEIRYIEPERMLLGEPGPPSQRYWMRLHGVGPAGSLTSDPGAHACGVAYLSDYWLAGVFRAAVDDWHAAAQLYVHSLNHGIFFHNPAAADDWLLFESECLWTQHGRTLAAGRVFSRSGTPIASVIQEALLRPGRPRV